MSRKTAKRALARLENTMPYIRKTEDEYQIQQYTSQGWEEVCAESTWKEARERRNEYRENQPEYPVRIVKKRIKLTVEG